MIPFAASGQPVGPGGALTPLPTSDEPQPYIVKGVATKEQRSAIARTGAGIEEESASQVLMRATAHGTNSPSADYLRVKIVGTTTTQVLQELGRQRTTMRPGQPPM